MKPFLWNHWNHSINIIYPISRIPRPKLCNNCSHKQKSDYQLMTQLAPLYSRIFTAPNSSKTLQYHRILAVGPLLRPSAVGFSRMSSAAADSVAFPLSPSSLIKILKGDITRWSVDGSSDAIVRILLSFLTSVCKSMYSGMSFYLEMEKIGVL